MILVAEEKVLFEGFPGGFHQDISRLGYASEDEDMRWSIAAGHVGQSETEDFPCFLVSIDGDRVSGFGQNGKAAVVCGFGRLV